MTLRMTNLVHRRMMGPLALGAGLALYAGPAVAQGSAPAPPVITWQPEQLVQGSIVRLSVRPPATDLVLGIASSVAGEPLHFEVDAREREGDTFWALAGIPIDAPEHLEVDVILHFATRSDTVVARLPVAKRNAPMQRLTVAPQYGRKPDSALARRLARERAQSRQVSRNAHRSTRLWAGPFVRPRAGQVTGQFGRGRLYNGQVTGRHMGVDIDGETGDPVVAANRGVVALVAHFYLAGKAIYIDHGAGLVTAYFHLSRIDVAPGDTVATGQQIGAVGASGRVTGPHLHWVARYGTVTVDAETLLGVGGE